MQSNRSSLSFPERDNRHYPRHLARHEICLQADLSLLDAETTIAHGEEGSLTIFGSTHDLSEAGVSLIVPFVSIDERYCFKKAQPLPLTLYLPIGQVNMQIAPVRYLPLDEGEPDEGFLMGAEITQMDEVERVRFIEYLRTYTEPSP